MEAGGVPGIPTDSTDNSRQKKMTELTQEQNISSAGCIFPYTYQITHQSNDVKLESKISEFLPIITKVNFLAEANYIPTRYL